MSARLPLLDDLDRMLRTDRFGRSVHGFRVIDSTNAVGLRLAAEGAAEGTLVVADAQTAGRGRFRRSWDAAPGLNLLFSLVLRPPLDPDRLGLIPLAAGVAAAEAVEPFVAPLRAQIKWPNDVLLGGRKTCGILLETTVRIDTRPTVVLGVGVNVNQVDFPAALHDRATSLRLEAGRTVPRADLLARLLAVLERRYDALLRDGGTDVLAATRARLVDLGRSVTLTDASGAVVTGRVLGLAPDGALRLDVDGRTLTFHAGETTLRVAPTPP